MPDIRYGGMEVMMFAASRMTPHGAVLMSGLVVALVLGAWAASRPDRLVVLFPPAGLERALPDGARLISASPLELLIEGGAGLTAALHAAGAEIVLRDGRSGCNAPVLP